MATATMTVRDFRSNLASWLDRADAGEELYLQRDRRRYMVVALTNEDTEISPALEARIAKARQNMRDGNVTRLSSPQEIDDFLIRLRDR